MSDSMSDRLKKKLSAKSVTAIILFGAIILVFVFFGLPGPMGAAIGSVARVNDTLISVADFQQEENRVQQYYQNLFGNQMDFSSQRQLLRQQSLENLIRMELVAQATKAEGILVTDLEVRDFIVKDVPFFQQNGQFQRELYGRYLEATRMNAGAFEDKVRKDVANVRAHHLFEIAAQPMAIEIAKIKEMKEQKINVSFVKIDNESLIKGGMTREKIDEAVKSLEEALTKGDENAVNASLKDLKGSWEETGFVEYAADSFPKLTSQTAAEAVYELNPKQPLLKRLVRDGNFKYVMKLKGFKTEPAAEVVGPVAIEMLQKRRAEGQFEAWVNQFRLKSHVTMNKQILEM